jgi:hypothetical protein
VTIVRALESDALTHELATQVVAAIPHGQLLELPGSHNLPLEEPDTIAQLVDHATAGY